MLAIRDANKLKNSGISVAVGMSGGVDSSVSALVLKEQGYHVIGMFMKNWEEKTPDGICTSAADYEDVARVCKHIDIPFYGLNFVKEYWDSVFRHFIEEFRLGFTPNPDILCNREIKFKAFYDKAKQLGVDYLATGHYCRNELSNGKHLLVKGVDGNKDQTYFLYTIKERILQNVLFPIGNLQKTQVREIARKNALATAEKKDSTGVCFIGERNFKQFLSQYINPRPGKFETLDGKVIGEHDGIAYYTIGQRKGLAIGGPGEAWFVIGKDPQRNVVLVGQGAMHPGLYCDELVATDLTWVSEDAPAYPLSCFAKIRYRQPDQECIIKSADNGKLNVCFKIPQRAVTPRQSIVFYQGEVCLGGGIIESAGPSYYERGLSLPDRVSP